MDSLTLDGAMRLIACRHRVTPADLVTDTSEERILVWLYHGESTIAEVKSIPRIVADAATKTGRDRKEFSVERITEEQYQTLKPFLSN